jgi:hypothetical protein
VCYEGREKEKGMKNKEDENKRKQKKSIRT